MLLFIERVMKVQPCGGARKTMIGGCPTAALKDDCGVCFGFSLTNRLPSDVHAGKQANRRSYGTDPGMWGPHSARVAQLEVLQILYSNPDRQKRA